MLLVMGVDSSSSSFLNAVFSSLLVRYLVNFSKIVCHTHHIRMSLGTIVPVSMKWYHTGFEINNEKDKFMLSCLKKLTRNGSKNSTINGGGVLDGVISSPDDRHSACKKVNIIEMKEIGACFDLARYYQY